MADLQSKSSVSHLFIHLVICVLQNYYCNVSYVIYLMFELPYLIIFMT